jgi:hypothetical protein
MGLAPPWPPNLPDAFLPLVKEAEGKTQDVTAADAAKDPSSLKKKPVGAVVAPGKAVTVQPREKPPETPAEKAAPPAEVKSTGPVIKRSAFRKATGTVVEVPTRLPPKPMQEVKGRVTPAVEPPEPGPPKVEPKEEGAVDKISPLLGIPAAPSRLSEELKFDSRGKRVPRSDRWEEERFGWPEPVLPSSDLPPPRRFKEAPGPFTQRVQSLFDDRPEAVDRLCAAAEARAAIAGSDRMMRELGHELARKPWQGRKAPPEQKARLQGVAADERQPEPWRAVARFVLEKFSVVEPATGQSS